MIDVGPSEGGQIVVRLRGDIDISASAALRTALGDVIDGGCRDLVVDVSEVTFLDSTALGVLVGALKRSAASDGSVRLRSPSPFVERLLGATGLTDVLAVDQPG